jgi:hypothetical protein
MKKYLLIFCIFLLPGLMVSAQADDPKTLYANAKTFMQAGDFDNAIIVLNRALQIDKNNLAMQKTSPCHTITNGIIKSARPGKLLPIAMMQMQFVTRSRKCL